MEKSLLEVNFLVEEAEKARKRKDSLGFMEKISKAEIIALHNNDSLARVLIIKAVGLVKLNQYKKALSAINEAFQHVKEDADIFTLKNYEGICYGHLGKFGEALNIFKELTERNFSNVEELVEVYLNLVWVHFTVYKTIKVIDSLGEVHKCLELLMKHFEELPNKFKVRILNNYGVYYFYTKEFDEAIRSFEESIQYCEEKNCPWIYANLAEIYLQYDDGLDYSIEIKECTQKAEILAEKYQDNFSMGKIFYIQAMSELKMGDIFKSLDALYLAFEYFKNAGNYPELFECLVKINEIVSDYKIDRLNSFKDSLLREFKDTTFENIL